MDGACTPSSYYVSGVSNRYIAKGKTMMINKQNETLLIEVLPGKLKRFTGDGWEHEDDVTMVTLHRVDES
jgi:hypothetical protein